MSLPQTFGDPHKFGLYGTTNFITLQSDDLSYKPTLDVEVMNETGVVVTDRLDDLRTETTLTGVLKTGDSISIPSVGQTITYPTTGGTIYIIKQVDDAGTNNGFRKITMKLVKYQGIAAT
jgi:hypothetical protein